MQAYLFGFQQFMLVNVCIVCGLEISEIMKNYWLADTLCCSEVSHIHLEQLNLLHFLPEPVCSK